MSVSNGGSPPPGWLVLPALLALALVAGTACGGGAAGGKSDDKAPASGVSASPITIEMKDNVYNPKEITVPVGKSVTVTVKNTGIAIHNMHILSKDGEGKDISSAALVNPGADNKFEVRLTKAATYKFQCDYHLPDMVGTITAK